MAPLRRRSSVLPVIAALLGTLGAACREKAPSPGEPTVVPRAPAPTAAAAPEGPRAEFHDAAFDLVIRPVGQYAVGMPGTVEIALTPRGEYHCNEKYPYKLKVAESPGVRYAAPVVGMEAVKLEASRAVLGVGFTPETPGEKTVGGQLSFSVCSEDRCLIEKRSLALVVAVK